LWKPSTGNSIPGRIFVIGLSVAGLTLAYQPPATMVEIATETFTGLAVLFPTVLFGLYWKRVYSAPAILSILAGETILIFLHFKLILPDPFLPVIPVMLVAFGVYLVAHLLLRLKEGNLAIRLPVWLTNRYFLILTGIFLSAMDFWAWGSVQPTIMGFPAWMAYFVLLSAAQMAVMANLIRNES
jgi:SSS family solute:Na+ symporter